MLHLDPPSSKAWKKKNRWIMADTKKYYQPKVFYGCIKEVKWISLNGLNVSKDIER